MLAGFAAEACSGDLFEIEAAHAYPADYHACTGADVARCCPGANVRPGLAVRGSDAPRSRAKVEAWLSREL